MKSRRLGLSILLIALLCISQTLLAEFQVGQTYHGFKLDEKRFVKEVNAECYVFKHEKSGARLLKIASDDPNKTFSISFKTVPNSDCGTPHIMEHCVLNGSKNFPVKSPFDILSRGSLNTFLNAMTGSDITIYPVASMNDKDFFNLMHVYLDAVLNPLIYDDPRIFMQEGWHHELTAAEEPVVYKGVVYNEMKGAFSDATRELDYQISQNLFPDNEYHFSSGGYPEAIPDLTYEEFLDFHRKYYHPTNSYIFLYGNGDLDKELTFIDAEYLSKYDVSDRKVIIEPQKSFDEPKEVVSTYPVLEGDDTADQTFLALDILAGVSTDQALTMSLDILTDVLVNQESAPIRLALQEAGIGKDVSAYMSEMQQNIFEIVVRNANPEDLPKFRKIVMTTLQDVVKNGLDKEAVEGTINRMEFNLREGDDAQKGLTHNFHVLNTWFWAEDPLKGLEYEKPLKEVKQALTSNYLEEVIQKYLVDNKHALFTALKPEPGLEKKRTEKITAELADYKANLNPDEIEKLVQQTNELIEYQKREDTPEALATIPLLEKSDINPNAQWYSLTEGKIAKVKALNYETFTNNVVHSKLLFDMQSLPEEMLPYAALLAEVMGSMNTENFTYGDLDKVLNIHTGGFSTGLTTYLKGRNDDGLVGYFQVSSKAMNDKLPKQYELIREIVNNTKYDDKERLQEVLQRHQSRLDSQVKRNGFGVARGRAVSYNSRQGRFNEITRGLGYYWFITDLTNNFDKKADEIIANLQKASDLIFTQKNLLVATTCSKDDYTALKRPVKAFIKTLPKVESDPQVWKLVSDVKNEGIQSPSKVQYVIKAYDYKKLGYEWDGKMNVLSQILSTDWLQNQVRVIGGAYGGFSAISYTGQIYFASYRDPNLTETLENYDRTPEYLETFEADESTMTRYIIGTISRMDRPMTPSEEGGRALRRYLEGTTFEQISGDRKAVINTTAEDIRNMQKFIADFLATNTYCVYGNEEKVSANADVFDKVITLEK